MTKSEEITENIFRLISEYKGQEREMVESAINAALNDAFNNGMQDGKSWFNPDVQAFEIFHTDFEDYNKAGFEYPGFTF